MFRAALGWAGRIVLFALIGLCFAPTAVPPLLDRIYYRGPASDHFDGERFFNPGQPPAVAGSARRLFSRWAGQRMEWPEHVPVRQTVPPRHAASGEMLVTWIGHATVLVQVEGLNLLTDPIWSETASPFPPIGPERVRAPGVRFEDLPRIDLVLISHNHYDHMDLPTLRRLWARDRPTIVTSLGNDTILRGEGVSSYALDWTQKLYMEGDAPQVLNADDKIEYICDGSAWQCGRRFEVVAERNHHWGSRWIVDRNRALWSAFTVNTPAGRIFFAGDTGWGDGSWAREAARHGPFRLAILPIGAYEPREVMAQSHVNPDEAMRIFDALNPVTALGMHWGTFQLTFEAIDAPPQAIAALARARGIAPNRFVTTEVGRTFRAPAAR